MHREKRMHHFYACVGAKELFFSSSEPKAPGELSIGRLRCPSVRLSTISNDFSSETSRPIITKFHIQPPGPLGKKNSSNGLDHNHDEVGRHAHIW